MLTRPNKTTNNVAPKQTTEQYVQSRIDDAVSKGYSSTKIWIKKENREELVRLLDSSGFRFEISNEEPKSIQFKVEW